jgi:hypothetical protein
MFAVTEAEAAAIRTVFEQRARGRRRAAPPVPGRDRQCAGSGMRSDHRRLEAVAREAPADPATRQAAVADQQGGLVKIG